MPRARPPPSLPDAQNARYAADTLISWANGGRRQGGSERGRMGGAGREGGMVRRADNRWNGNGINVFPHYGRTGERESGRTRTDGPWDLGESERARAARASHSSPRWDAAARQAGGRSGGNACWRRDGRFINRPRIAAPPILSAFLACCRITPQPAASNSKNSNSAVARKPSVGNEGPSFALNSNAMPTTFKLETCALRN